MTTDREPLTVSEAILRAENALLVAFDAKYADGAPATEPVRQTMAAMGTGYACLASALQAEREYEERKFREITEQANGQVQEPRD